MRVRLDHFNDLFLKNPSSDVFVPQLIVGRIYIYIYIYVSVIAGRTQLAATVAARHVGRASS